jgi:hypothetical protein
VPLFVPGVPLFVPGVPTPDVGCVGANVRFSSPNGIAPDPTEHESGAGRSLRTIVDRDLFRSHRQNNGRSGAE